MSLAIYYCAPVSAAGGFPRSHYADQIRYLKRFGRVLTEHLGSDAATSGHDAALGPAAIYSQDMAWLAEADVVVADITFPSTGTGLALGAAVAQRKKIIALFDQARGRASALTAGCPGMLVRPYSSAKEWQRLVRFFIPPARIFLFGAPGSGKGTLAADLAAHLGLIHVSTGDVLRAYRREKAGTDDALATELATHMDAGRLVPAPLMASIVSVKLAEPAVRRRGYVLDGYPPSMADADEMRRAGVFPSSVLVLECPPAVAAARQVSRAARATDTPDVAAARVATYAEQTLPVIASYPEELRVTVDATLDIAGVRAAALEGLWRQFEGSFAAWGESSYVFHAGPCTTARFHSHVDAVNHGYLRAALARMAKTDSTVKNYPVCDLELGPQSNPTDGGFGAVYAKAAEPFAPVYKRLCNFHRIAGNPIDEAFTTVQMGADGLDYPQLASALEVAASYRFGEVLVEIEEDVFHGAVDPATGALSVAMDLGETPYAVDFARLPPVALERRLPADVTPRFELHHGFDIAKTEETEPLPPIDPKRVVAGTTAEAGMAVGGWFVFAKAGVWAYRCNQFSNSDYAACVADLKAQAAALHAWLGRAAPGRKVLEQSCSLEKVLCMWPFH
jgi:adenylate kinase